MKGERKINYNKKKRLKLKKLLISKIADLIIEEVGGKSCCLSCSWLISNILNAYSQAYNIPQLKCYPVIVSMFITNQIGEEFCYKYYEDLIQELRLGRLEQNRERLTKLSKNLRKNEQIWTIGNFWNPAEENKKEIYEGFFHSVITFEDKSILDMTIDQMCRPEKNLYIKRFWNHRLNLPTNIILFKVEESPRHYPAIAYSPNLQKVSNTISKIIAEVLQFPELTITYKNINPMTIEEWENMKKITDQQIEKVQQEQKEKEVIQ